MVLIQSLIINFLVIFLFLQIGNFFSNKFKLEEYYEKILFGFSIFTLLNFFFYFVFYFSVKKIIFIWIITLVCIFFSNIFYSRKINFIKFGLSVSKFIIPITIIYILIPIFFGEQFYVFRGNHWDLFSYLSIASLFNDITFNNILSNEIPRFYLHFENIEKISISRPITSFLLGVFLNLKNIDIYLLVYLFKLFFVILTSMSIYLFFNKINISRLKSFFFSLIFSLSFWIIYIFEIDALSHLVSMPIFILIISEMINIDNNIKSKNNLFITYFAIINSALFLIYPEIFIISSLIVSICLIVGFLKNKLFLKDYIFFLIKSSIIFIIITAFAYKTNYQFIYEQSLFVLTQNKDWWGYFGSFILGRDNLVLDKLFVDQVKIYLSNNTFFQTLILINNSQIENNFNFYYLNFIPSLFGLYYISVGKIDNPFIYLEVILVIILQAYLIYHLSKNMILLSKIKNLLISFLAIIILSFFMIINGNIWTLIKIYFYISPFIFITIASKFSLDKGKITLKINTLVCILLLIFPIYKYSSNNFGIGRLDSFPAIMHPEMKQNFNWTFNLNKLQKCDFVTFENDDYFKKSYLILKFLHNSINSNITYNNNEKKINNCYLIVENNRFIIKK